MSKLTEKQKMFCKEFLVDLNATQAAIRAGYSKNTASIQGHENLRKPNIQKHIQELMDKRSERVELTADKVLMDIDEIKRRCMQHTPVLEYDKGLGEYVETGEYTFNAKDALKALELQGKHLKLFTEKVESEISGNVTVNFNMPERDFSKINELKVEGKI